MVEAMDDVCAHCRCTGQRRCCYVDANPWHRLTEFRVIKISIDVAANPTHPVTQFFLEDTL